MTNDLKDLVPALVPAQEKLEWVTPKISLMDAGDTDGSNKADQWTKEQTFVHPWGVFPAGVS